MFSELGVGYLVLEWVIRLIMVVVIPLRRPSQAAQSWLLLIFFLPVPGLLLYAAIGRPTFPAWRTERFRRVQPLLAGVAAKTRAAVSLESPSDTSATENLAERLGGFAPVDGNTVTFLTDYDETIRRLVADIDAAKVSVRLLVYIFADDAVGRPVAAALARAVARGVACHVIFDPVGSHHWRRGTLKLLRDAGVEVREALPLRLVHLRSRTDMRNHRKLFLIDGRIGYGGSQNIVAKDFRPGVTNQELVLRAEGPLATQLGAIFVADWFLETEILLPLADVPAERGAAVAQALPSGASYPVAGFETLLVWHIHTARRRVVITTPYLIPDEDLIGAMRTAALRGVDVVLIVSEIADQKLVSLAQQSYYDELLRSGVEIFLYRGFLLHAKSIGIDDHLAIVGSSNVDIRSFRLNEEVSILFYDPASIAGLKAVEARSLAASRALSLDEWRHRPAIAKFLENLARLISPLL